MARPNVIIITFDCLRPDRLGFAGYRGVDTPAFDGLARESLVCENAYCQAPNTWVSHASMFTGCLPAVHGMRTPLRKLNPGVATLAEVMKAAGYCTFALPAMSLLSSEAGFARGFDEYDLSGLKWSLDNVLKHRTFRTADLTLQKVRGVMDRAREPFFLWVHHFGTHNVSHTMLEMPQDYLARYSEYAQHYDAKVSYADQAFLRPLVGELEKRSMLDRTVLALWSDHGESLHDLEHLEGRGGHNLGLEEDVVRTLLMMRLPGGRSASRRATLASSTDILPTTCEACGVACPDQVQGTSLLTPPQRPQDAVAYFENLCQGFLGIRHGDWKLVLGLPEEQPDDLSTETDAREQTQDPENEHVRLGAKMKWRWDMIAQTLRTVLGSTTDKRGARRNAAEGGRLHRWWLTGKEPEEVARELLASGPGRLWTFDGNRPRPAQNREVEARLVERLRQLALPPDGAVPVQMSDEERRRVEDGLSALGYM